MDVIREVKMTRLGPHDGGSFADPTQSITVESRDLTKSCGNPSLPLPSFFPSPSPLLLWQFLLLRPYPICVKKYLLFAVLATSPAIPVNP